MSNLEVRPQETTCAPSATPSASRSPHPPETDEPTGSLRPPGPDDSATVRVLSPREVPLGGPRAMTVRRTLPQRAVSLIGGWCFVDHYGPDRVSATGGMRVPPHPHTGLQTVSWLFTGEIEHRDSAGHHAMVRPGELNLMTAGRGISHSEVSTAETDVLHGVQLWVALPSAARFVEPGFEHHVPDPVHGDGFEARVFMGALLGAVSPVVTHSPLLGAEVRIDAGRRLRFGVSPEFEHGLLVDQGTVDVAGTEVGPGELAYLPPGRDVVDVTASAGAPARAVVLGGEPLGESIVMWWNFVGRSHEEIVEFRARWQEQLAAAADTNMRDAPFGEVVGNTLAPLPAPALPNGRLRPRE